MGLSMRDSLRSLRRFPLLYGVTWALFWAAVGTLLVSLWAHFASASDAHLRAAAYVIHCAAVLAGSFCSSRAAGERGWYYGGLTGLVYALAMMAIGAVVYDTFSFDPGGLFRTLVMACIGAFGGILGVNTRSH
ncbi:MAG: TIGR04086 family membrane protein [Alicyclobacillus sp.]|nr:TIGR04086 family membrane protein [Alicyclobacillus sp.]